MYPASIAIHGSSSRIPEDSASWPNSAIESEGGGPRGHFAANRELGADGDGRQPENAWNVPFRPVVRDSNLPSFSAGSYEQKRPGWLPAACFQNLDLKIGATSYALAVARAFSRALRRLL